MIILVMGVSGVGKSTIGKLLSIELGFKFIDADDFHSTENIEKMRKGVALNSFDRKPWLKKLANELNSQSNNNESTVIACSALKRSYRKILMESHVIFHVIWLYGAFDLINRRVASRCNHFMSSDLICSQFIDLEEPDNALCIEVNRTKEDIISEIVSYLENNRCKI